jgi:hypothetical protein
LQKRDLLAATIDEIDSFFAGLRLLFGSYATPATGLGQTANIATETQRAGITRPWRFSA